MLTRTIATAAAAAVIAVPGLSPAPAGAEPVPPPEPVVPAPALPLPPAPPPTAAELTAEDPGAALTGLIGTGAAVAAITPDMLGTASLLFPQNYRMPGDDQLSPYPLTEGVPPGPFARIDAYRGVHALLHGALGRMPRDQLGVPLPGTAPLPGAVLPPGLEQFLPPPP